MANLAKMAHYINNYYEHLSFLIMHACIGDAVLSHGLVAVAGLIADADDGRRTHQPDIQAALINGVYRE